MRSPCAGERHEEDASRPLRNHRSDGDLPGDRPRGVDGETVNGAPPLARDVLGRRRELTAGVVDQNVDASEPLQGPIDQGGHLLFFANVRGHGERPSAQCLDLGDGLLEGLGPAAADHDVGSTPRHVQCDRAPYPGASTGDQCHPPAMDVGAQHLPGASTWFSHSIERSPLVATVPTNGV